MAYEILMHVVIIRLGIGMAFASGMPKEISAQKFGFLCLFGLKLWILSWIS